MKDGEYYYRPHRTHWGVWRNTNTSDGARGTFIRDFYTKEEAKRFVYDNNGWKEKT